jgi:hypothetical protein
MQRTKLRVRPDKIRFFILGVSNDDITVSSAHRSLELAISKGVHTIYIADLQTNRIITETHPRKFLDWWAEHYDDPKSIYD